MRVTPAVPPNGGSSSDRRDLSSTGSLPSPSAPPGSAPWQPRVSVIICAYTEKRWAQLTAAVHSCLAQRRAPEQVILVVDHNADLLRRAREAFPAAGFPAVEVVANRYRRGLSGARNTGVERATGDIVAFLDDDARADEDWIEHLVAPYADPAVQGTGGSVVAEWSGGRPSWFPPEFDWVVGCGYPGLPTSVAQIRNPIGAGMSVRRAVFETVGGFSDGIGRIGATPLGCEETEFFIRLHQRVPGARVLHVPDARVTHLVTAERASWAYFARRCYAEGLSKAAVSRRVGAGPALSAERAYLRSTLPRGLARDLASPGRWARAGAILAGTSLTGLGYARGLLARPAPPPASGMTPAEKGPAAEVPVEAMWSGELELADSRADLSAAGGGRAGDTSRRLVTPAGTPYRRARLLARLHGVPVGFAVVDTPDGTFDPDAVRATVRRDLAADITAVSEDIRTFGELADFSSEILSAEMSPSPETSPATTLPAHADAGDAGIGAGARRGQAYRPRVSVVVCTRDRAERLPACLARLRALRYPELEIIIVDNAPSDDATRTVFEREVGDDPRFRYAREDVPGLSRARNRGLAEATGELIAFTDDDVAVDPWWVCGLVRGFTRRADVVCVTGLVPAATLDSAAELYFDARVSWATSCVPRVYDARPDSGTSALHPFTAGLFGTGANFAVRTDVLRALGGFDEALGAGTPTGGGEDIDLFLRVLLAGHALAYEPAALVWHSHRSDLESLRRQLFAYGTGLSAYLSKHLADPRSRRQMVTRIPGAVRHMRSLTQRGAESLAAPGGSAPTLARTLQAREWLGLAVGPVYYLRSRRRAAGLRAVKPQSAGSLPGRRPAGRHRPGAGDRPSARPAGPARTDAHPAAEVRS